jgi:hypothetical protein
MALLTLLRDRVHEIRLMQVGGSSRLNGSMVARPEGATDVASAVLGAVQARPEAILICSDGYENVRQGDTASLIDGLGRLGVGLAIMQVVPVFAAGEDLSRRGLAREIPILAIQHEADIGELLVRLFLASAPADLGGDDINRVRRFLFRSSGGAQES